MMASYIRPFHPSDLIYLYRICLQTGDSGKDATNKYKDPYLLGHFYAAPYAVLEPEVCFVLICNGLPCGYIVGTKDSQKFYKRCEMDWFIPLRERYPYPKDSDNLPDDIIKRLIHKGHVPNKDLSDYPAHLHIDILPEGQGLGMGRKLIETFINRLQEFNVKGVHLLVGKKNTNAILFYEKVGFKRLIEYEKAIAFVKKLNE